MIRRGTHGLVSLVFCLVSVALLTETAWAQLVIQGEAEWRTWNKRGEQELNFDGLIEFSEDGGLSLASFPDELDVAHSDWEGEKDGTPTWPCFETKKDWSGYDPTDPSGFVSCGAWRAGSTTTESNSDWLDSNGQSFESAKENILDGDPLTFWKPDPAAEASDWWIEINLGRMVNVTRVRLIFPDREGAEPFGDFRVLATRGVWRPGDVFTWAGVAGTTGFNRDSEVVYELGQWRELTHRVVENAESATAAVDIEPKSFSTMSILRIQAKSKKPEQPALAEVEVWAEGENVSLQALQRGGTIDEPSVANFGTKMIDGDFESFYAQDLGRGKNLQISWILDLGAAFWVKSIALMGAEFRQHYVSDFHSDHLLLGSDQSPGLRFATGLTMDVMHDFDTTVEVGGRDEVLYSFPEPRALTYVGALYDDSFPGQVSEIVVYPTGHVAELKLQSDFINLAEKAAEQGVDGAGFADIAVEVPDPEDETQTITEIQELPVDRNGVVLGAQQITALNFDALEPPGSRVTFRTRTGERITNAVTYYDRAGVILIGGKEEYDGLKSFQQGTPDTAEAAGPDWSEWSQEYDRSGIFLSPSPKKYLQIQAFLQALDPDVTPTLNSLSVDFEPAALENVLGLISPREVAPGVDTLFTYSIWGTGGEFDKLRIRTLTGVEGEPAVLLSNADQARTPITVVPNTATPGFLEIDLGAQIVEGDTVHVQMRTYIDRNPTHFKADVQLEDPDRETPLWQQVSPAVLPTSEGDPCVSNRGVDAAGLARSDLLQTCDDFSATLVFFDEVPGINDLLNAITIEPAVATPNGDTVGDVAEIKFQLWNVTAIPEVWIHTLDGQPVRQLTGARGTDGFFVFPWDGTNESEKLAPPGIYLARINSNTQHDEKQITRTIGLAY